MRSILLPGRLGSRFKPVDGHFSETAFYRSGRPAFTLIELLVVVGMMAIMMTITIPFLHSTMSRRRGMNGAVKDVQEVCKLARDFAILKQSTHELRIRPGDGVFEVVAAGGGAGDAAGNLLPGSITGESSASVEEAKPRGGRISRGTKSGASSVTLPEGVVVEGLGVNGLDWTEDEVARVRFYANGTSDEMSVVLYRLETDERRNVWLEVVTGLAEIETDPQKFRHR